MKPLAWIIIGLIAFGALLASCVALVNDDDDQSLRVVLVAHRGDPCRYEDCGDDWGGGSDGNSGGDYEGGRSGDNDQRGDHNCRNFCFYGVPIPGGDQKPPPERGTMGSVVPGSEQRRGSGGDTGPSSLFPVPTPGGVQKFVMSTIEAGIGLGRLFANATIDFVSSMLVGLA